MVARNRIANDTRTMKRRNDEGGGGSTSQRVAYCLIADGVVL